MPHGSVSGQLGGRRLAAHGQGGERGPLGLGQPGVRVAADAGLRQPGQHLAALAGRHGAGARRLDQRGVVQRRDEYRPAHAQQPDQRPVLTAQPGSHTPPSKVLLA
jgi:hypothetical protein